MFHCKTNDTINELPIDTEELFREMTGYLAANYYPVKNDDDTIHELACGEFFRIREIICRKYGFDEDLYILEGDGTSPFDFVRDDIEQEVYKRMETLSISNEPYRCTNCGSTHVQHKAWVRTNKNNEYVGDAWEGEPDEDDCWTYASMPKPSMKTNGRTAITSLFTRAATAMSIPFGVMSHDNPCIIFLIL